METFDSANVSFVSVKIAKKATCDYTFLTE